MAFAQRAAQRQAQPPDIWPRRAAVDLRQQSVRQAANIFFGVLLPLLLVVLVAQVVPHILCRHRLGNPFHLHRPGRLQHHLHGVGIESDDIGRLVALADRIELARMLRGGWEIKRPVGVAEQPQLNRHIAQQRGWRVGVGLVGNVVDIARVAQVEPADLPILYRHHAGRTNKAASGPQLVGILRQQQVFGRALRAKQVGQRQGEIHAVAQSIRQRAERRDALGQRRGQARNFQARHRIGRAHCRFLRGAQLRLRGLQLRSQRDAQGLRCVALLQNRRQPGVCLVGGGGQLGGSIDQRRGSSQIGGGRGLASGGLHQWRGRHAQCGSVGAGFRQQRAKRGQLLGAWLAAGIGPQRLHIVQQRRQGWRNFQCQSRQRQGLVDAAQWLGGGWLKRRKVDLHPCMRGAGQRGARLFELRASTRYALAQARAIERRGTGRGQQRPKDGKCIIGRRA